MMQSNSATPQTKNRIANIGVLVTAFVAVLTLWFGKEQFDEQREQFDQSLRQQNAHFKESMESQADQFTKTLALQDELAKRQQAQFIQQEMRLQRQRYTELVDILWSENDDTPIYNEKLRAEALKEFLETKWSPDLKLSTILTGARLENILIDNSNWVEFDFSGSKMMGASIQNADLNKANLSKTNLSKANLSYANFTESDLAKSNLSFANVYDTNFYQATLSNAILIGVNQNDPYSLEGLDEHYNLDSKFRRFYFMGKISKKTNFSKSNLRGADLSQANLYNANFKLADLMGAKFKGADLRGADLEGAILFRPSGRWGNHYRTDFRGAKNLTCKQLKTAIGWEHAYRDKKLACGASIPIKEN
jgi:uncharacterized protein YjbI with pentapeptide repeats